MTLSTFERKVLSRVSAHGYKFLLTKEKEERREEEATIQRKAGECKGDYIICKRAV